MSDSDLQESSTLSDKLKQCARKREAQRNILTIAQAKERFFTETHEKFVESVPQLLKKLLDEKAGRD